MALFGFAINFKSGDTDYIIVAAPGLTEAETEVAVKVGNDNVESVTVYGVEAIVEWQFDCCAKLVVASDGGF